ncbi:hypothetical protein MtrunA17_Chr5g0414951 [Medicago truncatula]|nr:hypothetical protein MtrunA17_Chr5g0414951 [Medicago truncatula]
MLVPKTVLQNIEASEISESRYASAMTGPISVLQIRKLIGHFPCDVVIFSTSKCTCYLYRELLFMSIFEV